MIKYSLSILFTFYFMGCSSSIQFNAHNNILMITFPVEKNPREILSYESEIVSYNFLTKEYHRFTNDNFDDSDPSWSPSGEKILFCSKRPFTGYFGGAAPKKLFILDILSDEIKPVIIKSISDNYSSSITDFDNSVWSPVSNEIAFSITYLDSSSLIIYDLDTDELKLTMNVPDIYDISWSSDGQFIGYQGIHTEHSGNEISMTFELGFIDIKNQKKMILEQTDRLSWDLIGGINENNNFMIYNSDSAKAPMKIYEYDVIANDKKHLTTTMERWPRECGATVNEILFVKTAENNSQDIWLLNIKMNSFKQITFDGKSKADLKYFRK